MTTMAHQDTEDTLERGFGRAALERVMLYRWLGRLFQRECDEGTLNWHRSEQGQEFLNTLAAYKPFRVGAKKVISALRSKRKIEDEVVRFAGSFSTLFHGVDPSHAAPPYESHYTEETGRLFGEATVRMQEILSRYGLTLVGFSEPADHISVHLQLMAHFSELMAGHDMGSLAAAELIAAQADFLDNHLSGWVQDFAKDCILFDRTGLYAGAAEILLAFLEDEKTRLSISYRVREEDVEEVY